MSKILIDNTQIKKGSRLLVDAKELINSF